MARARFIAREDFGSAAWGALAGELGMPQDAREYLSHGAPQFRLLLEELSGEEIGALRQAVGAADVPGHEAFPQLWWGDRERARGSVILSGRLEQLERLLSSLSEREPGPTLRAASILSANVARVRWEVGGALLPARTAVMGVINVTPDSFSDGGKFLEAGPAITHGLRMVEEGADLLDVGGESTRPGGANYGAGMQEVSADEELRRVLPVIEGLARQTKVPLSIDTRKGAVARAALDAGARIVNDVSGLRFDPALLSAVVERGASLCLMHSQGDLRTMQLDPRYDDLIGEVALFLADAARRAREAGVPPGRIALDPGLGFGKTDAHNVELIRRLPALTALGHPVLVGASRKSFVGRLTGVKIAAERTAGSLAAAVLAAASGASVVRVHDVASTVEALRLTDAVIGG